MSFDHLKVESSDRIGWIEYRQPPLNAFNWEMPHEVPADMIPGHSSEVFLLSYFLPFRKFFTKNTGFPSPKIRVSPDIF